MSATAETATTWDVRDVLDRARVLRREEDDWLAAHEGALAASAIGGCLRKEKLRLLGAEPLPPTKQQMRRWAWGLMYQEEVRSLAAADGRKPRLRQEVDVEVEGIVILGHCDLVFSEAVVEVKTTSAWEMHAEYLPFPHLIQLGTYMFGLQRAGQLLYGNFHNEWSFDFPALPEMWEPWAREVARLFREGGEDPLAYPCERLYCASCEYREACPQEEAPEHDRPLTDLEAQIVERYLAARNAAKPAAKREEEAKASLLGVAGQIPMDERGVTRLRLPTKTVLVRQTIQHRTDYSALDPDVRENLPTKPVIVNTITVKESGDE